MALDSRRSLRRLATLLSIAIGGAAWCQDAPRNQNESLREELRPCHLTANEGRQEVEALCGTLAVPLDPNAPEGERIDLFVAIVEALAEEPRPDPLVVLAGGPGDAATRFFAMSEAAFSRTLRRRDVLLVDQRGTGNSAPLHCEELQQASRLDLSGADVDSVVELALDCLRKMANDPRFFTTSLAVADLDLVREALGYERLNLYGISYGTRVAQHYLRRFPQRVRSVVLDGVLPTQVALGPDIALASQAALDALFERCRAEAACAAAYPQLQHRFNATLERLREAPVDVSFNHPRTGATTDMAVDHTVLAGVVRLLLYSPQTASLLPPLVEAAHLGDYRQWAAQATVIDEALGELAVGLNYAVMCTEDVPFWASVDMAAQANTYLGTTLVEVTRGVCETWPAGFMDEGFKQPIESDAPILLLSGELDPITPPRYAELAAQSLTNAMSVVASGEGHGMLTVPCLQHVMAEFLEMADPSALDLSCVERIGPIPLFTSALGPAP